MRYLRSNINGMVFEWNEIMARNPDVKEVTEHEAYPERFAPVDLTKRKSSIELNIPKEVTVPPTEASPELRAEASKPFGRGERITPNKQPKKPMSTTEIVGLVGDF